MKSILILLAVLFLLVSCKTSTGDKQDSDPGTVAEKSFIALGGEEQYVEIMGTSPLNPVLLFLHGGPGWPQTPHLRYFNAKLAKSVTIVAWEQSGCGQSYMKNPNPEKLSIEQIVLDAHELTQILKKKFNKEKIYLAGFSWGSLPGLILIERYPEDYAGYFGITQVINVRESVRVSRAWIEEQAKAKGDQETLKAIKQLNEGDTAICKRDLDCFIAQYGLLSKYGGAIYTKKAEEEIAKAEKFYDDYKTYDWFNAFFYSGYRVEKDLFDTDLAYIKEVKVPVYFISGRHDWNLPTSITEKFMASLTAPKKEMIWFENSGHEPSSEEPEKFEEVILERVE